MSIKVMSYVWEHCRQKGSKKLMMLAIADHADDYGVAFPGVPRLATKCEMTERNAQSILSTLESEGEIAIDFKNGINTSHGNTNRYYLIQYRRSIGITGEEIITPRGEADFTPRDEEIITPGVIESSPKPSVEPSDEPSMSTDVDAGLSSQSTDEQLSDSKRPRKPDPIFDTLAELHWNIHDTTQVDKTTAIRINKIKAWLKENSPGATAETLRAFATWFCDETEGKASLPRDKAKFAERFVAFREYRNQQAQAPAPTPMVKVTDLYTELDGA